jgi:hypothetical protein
MTQGGIASFSDEILHAAVAGRRLFPFPFQLEIAELGIRDNVAAAFAQAVEPAVLDDPSFGGKLLFLKGAPPLRSLPIEEQFPAGGLFSISELIGGWGRRRGSTGEQEGQRTMGTEQEANYHGPIGNVVGGEWQ